MIREIGGTGEGNGPFIAFHDGFTGSPARQYNDVTTSPPLPGWLGWMPGMDRVALDTHPYLCFSKPNNDSISYQAAKVSSRRDVAETELTTARLNSLAPTGLPA